ncbi:MAG: NADP-dependent oxidoreductase [Sinobacteraceae bacterium]|nr:NADP-dependent oxidoreductase [Nevskiaceae bacterium]
MGKNRQWILVRRPEGDIRDGDLELRDSSVPAPRDGEVLIRTNYLSLDPTNRIWMSDMDQYMPPVALGDPMRGAVMGEVVESRAPAFKPGELVMTLGSWSDYCCVPAAAVQPVPALPGLEPKEAFGILLIVGPTAYFGLVDICAPRIGETLVVSAAAGAVGSLVGQIGKALGCRVVGIAGGPEKCGWITRELGFDAAIDYKSEDVAAALHKHCPNGIDIYFDNVGGAILDAALARMNLFGRVVECGLISTYNAKAPVPGPANYPAILMKRLKVQGMIVLDYAPRYAEAYRALATLRAQGKLKWRLHEVNGLETALDSVRLLYRGGNHGKLLVKVS